MSAGIVAAIAQPPGTPNAVEIPDTQVRSNLIISSAILSISSDEMPACAGVVAIALSITSCG
jgi:hypothetical protein